MQHATKGTKHKRCRIKPYLIKATPLRGVAALPRPRRAAALGGRPGAAGRATAPVVITDSGIHAAEPLGLAETP